MTLTDASKKWNISTRRLRTLCQEGRIKGAIFSFNHWIIPDESVKPIDMRHNSVPTLINTLEEKRKLVSTLGELNEKEKETLLDEFIVTNTHDSTTIEGNTLTLAETRLVLSGVAVSKPLKDNLEVLAHKEAFDYIISISNNPSPLTQEVIKHIHSFLLSFDKENAGVYRRIPVSIAGAVAQPVEPYLIERRMEEILERYLSSSDDFFTRLARFHLEFERVHPFIDGNGRVGRLLINLELLKNGYLPLNITYSERGKYYDAFDKYDRSKTITPMEKLLLTSLISSYEGYIALFRH